MRQPALLCSGARALRCLCLTAALLAPSFARAQPSPPAEPSTEAKKASPAPEHKLPSEAPPTTDRQASTPDKPADTAAPPAAAPRKGTPESPAFVDRDGDGIQDGQEHRFRHRKSAGKHRSGAGADCGGVRARERNGQEDGPKQHQGGR